MSHAGYPDLGNAIVCNDIRPNRMVECTVTGIHCGTFHTAFDAPSRLQPFSFSCTPCRLERIGTFSIDNEIHDDDVRIPRRIGSRVSFLAGK